MNLRADYIIPECYIDTNLVETLVCANGCNHQKGCNQVAKIMMEKYADRFAVGIIDADKRQPGYVKEFLEFCSSKHIKLLRHTVRPHFIVLVHPAADGFILSCAQSAHINMEDYGLSAELKGFTNQTKNIMSNKDMRFKRLFRSIENVGEMKLMRSLLSYFVEATYAVSNDKLAAIFREYEVKRM